MKRLLLFALVGVGLMICDANAFARGGAGGRRQPQRTHNASVADNSICPVIPDINTTGSAAMIGARSSRFAKYARQYKPAEVDASK
jgi:hypothetical protein